VAVVTSNLPMIFPVMRRWGGPIVNSVRSLGSSAKSAGSSNSTGKPYALEARHPRHGKGPRSVNPITDFTFSESEERICNDTAPLPMGGITKMVDVKVEEERRSRSLALDEEMAFGGSRVYDPGYALPKRSGEMHRLAPASRGDKRGSFNFIMKS
jgi:hypothetical protein